VYVHVGGDVELLDGRVVHAGSDVAGVDGNAAEGVDSERLEHSSFGKVEVAKGGCGHK
jgi:hypothetical protein